MKEETIPTMESVIEKHSNKKIFDNFYDGKQTITIERVLKAMTEWEQIKVAPLLAKIEELKYMLNLSGDIGANVYVNLQKRISELESSLTEKEKECEGYKKVVGLKNDEITEWRKQIEELKAENERLKEKAWMYDQLNK